MAKGRKEEVIIRREVCLKNNIDIEEYLVLLFLSVKPKRQYKDIINHFLDEGLITPIYRGENVVGYTLMDQAVNLIDTVVLESNSKIPKNRDVSNLALKLRDIFPPGKKDGTVQHWKGSTNDIKNRLLSFFEKYGEFTDDEIIEATSRYVQSFEKNGDYRNMRLLKYFIWKRENKYGQIEESSDLMSHLENKDDGKMAGNDWTTNLK